MPITSSGTTRLAATVSEKGTERMNKENVQLLISTIEKSKTFSMHAATWNYFRKDTDFGNHPCGSAACILGHAHQISRLSMGSFLGIPNEQKDMILTPVEDCANFRSKPGTEGYITKGHAIRMLRNLLKTGEVDWKSTKNPPKFDMGSWLSKLKSEEVVDA